MFIGFKTMVPSPDPPSPTAEFLHPKMHFNLENTRLTARQLQTLLEKEVIIRATVRHPSVHSVAYTIGRMQRVAYTIGRIGVDRGFSLNAKTHRRCAADCIRYALHRRTPKARTRHWGRLPRRKICVDRGMGNGRKDNSLLFSKASEFVRWVVGFWFFEFSWCWCDGLRWCACWRCVEVRNMFEMRLTYVWGAFDLRLRCAWLAFELRWLRGQTICQILKTH